MRDGLRLKTTWRAGEPGPGMWLRLTDPTVVDMLGDIGLDWLMFDASDTMGRPAAGPTQDR